MDAIGLFGAGGGCLGVFLVLHSLLFILPVRVKRAVLEWWLSLSWMNYWLSVMFYPTLLLMVVGWAWALYDALGLVSFEELERPSGVRAVLVVWVCGANIVGLCVVRKASRLLRSSPQAVLELEENIDTNLLLNFKPPSKELLARMNAPTKAILLPEFHNGARIPTQHTRLLFVSNHALGGLEMPLFLEGLYAEHNIYARGLGDNFHFIIPGWGETLSAFGAVDGTREVCSALMRAGQPILVYPGGSHEIMKQKSDAKYVLKWKKRTGFARLAIQHGYTIIPTASVGTEDMLDILADLPVGFVRKDLTIPVFCPNPKLLQRVYFSFGKPIETGCIKDKHGDPDVVWKIREQTREAVEELISELQEVQKEDPDRLLKDRVMKNMTEAHCKWREGLYGALNVAAVDSEKKTK
mmetsp:Transcript_17552/g.49377  ORF Transcript_17552/g.49377 Transcript_17552/m.49377 type:complete len:410 (+) Transcript_17552:67-1296(+)